MLVLGLWKEFRLRKCWKGFSQSGRQVFLNYSTSSELKVEEFLLQYGYLQMAASLTCFLTPPTSMLNVCFFSPCAFRTNNQLVAFLSKYRDMNFIKSHGRDNAR